MKKNEKGFTLVELLAVIVILGLLMAIAIPSVTKYITQSRIKTLVSSMDSYVTAVITQVNDGEYKFSDSTKVFAIPIECIALEKGGDNPLGNWSQSNSAYWAYVLVHYDNENYNYEYGFTFKDDAGYGLYPTINDKITNNLVKTGYNDLSQPRDGLAKNFVPINKWEGFTKLTDDTELVVLESTLDGEKGDGYNTCTLCQKEDNYSSIAESRIPANAVAITSSMTEAEVLNTLVSNPVVVLKGNASISDKYIELIQNVTLYSDGDYTLTVKNTAFLKGNGTLTVKSGNINAPKEFQITGDAALVVDKGDHNFGLLSISGNGVLTVNGGSISTHGYGSCGDIVMGNNATLNVNGGKLIFDGGWDWEINLSANNVSSHKPTNINVNITGGEIDAVSGVLLSVRQSLNNTSNTHINISGGTFRNVYHILMDWDAWSPATWADGIATITGGKFYFPEGSSDDYTKYIAAGYKAVTNADGSISIVKN